MVIRVAVIPASIGKMGTEKAASRTMDMEHVLSFVVILD